MNQYSVDTSKYNISKGCIDSHFHLFHMKNRGMQETEIINYCFSNGLAYALDIGINRANFALRAETAGKIPQLFTAHGYYPSECENSKIDSDIEYLKEILLQDKKAVALGEIGLDYFRMQGTRELQISLLEKQLKLADELSLPVVIHSRDAEEDTLSVLASYSPERKGIIHCYSYSAETALKFCELGYHISFAGNATYKNADIIQNAARSVPLEKLLLETDAPFLSPQKVRSKPNHPGFIGYTYDYIAELRQIPLEELVFSVRKNFLKLFNLQEL